MPPGTEVYALADALARAVHPSPPVEALDAALTHAGLRVGKAPQRLLAPSVHREVLEAHRDTLTDDRVIDALDWLLDAVTADREFLAIQADRAVNELCSLEDSLHGSLEGRALLANWHDEQEPVRTEPLPVEPLALTEEEVQREVDEGPLSGAAKRRRQLLVVEREMTDAEHDALDEGMRVGPKPLRCRLGFHKFDACSGVGPCERPGCYVIRKARVMPGGHGWIKHVEQPPEGSRPRGLPPR